MSKIAVATAERDQTHVGYTPQQLINAKTLIDRTNTPGGTPVFVTVKRFRTELKPLLEQHPDAPRTELWKQLELAEIFLAEPDENTALAIGSW